MRALLVTLATVALGLPVATADAKATASYHSPGYKGQDGGGSTPDVVSYCRLARGQKSCASNASLTPQAPAGGTSGPFSANLPGANQDTEGPAAPASARSSR